MTIVRSDPNSPGAHGGVRSGAGRPREYDAARVKLSLRRDLHGMLTKVCKKSGCSLTRALDFIVGRVVQDHSLEGALQLLSSGHENDAKNMLSSRIVVVAPAGVKAEEARGGKVVARVVEKNGKQSVDVKWCPEGKHRPGQKTCPACAPKKKPAKKKRK